MSCKPTRALGFPWAQTAILINKKILLFIPGIFSVRELYPMEDFYYFTNLFRSRRGVSGSSMVAPPFLVTWGKAPSGDDRSYRLVNNGGKCNSRMVSDTLVESVSQITALPSLSSGRSTNYATTNGKRDQNIIIIASRKVRIEEARTLDSSFCTPKRLLASRGQEHPVRATPTQESPKGTTTEAWLST